MDDAAAFDEEDSFSEAHSSFEYGSSAEMQGKGSENPL